MKKALVFTLITLVVLFGLIISGLITFPSQKSTLVRILFDPPSNPRSYSAEYEFNEHKYVLENEPPFAHLKKGEVRTTFPAIALWGDPEDPDHQQSLVPHLEGEYTMQFFLFMERSESRRARVLVEQIRGTETITSSLLRIIEPHSRYEILLNLQKNDRLVFTGKGKGMSAISHPVFYRTQQNSKKNLVFIICVDTLRPDHLGAYNPARTCSPHIDRLAQDAIRYTHAYSTSSWTLPALVSFFTGLTTFKHNVDYGNEVIRPDTPSLVEALSSKFVCYGFTGGAFTSSRYGMSKGFDFYQEKENDGWTRNASHLLFKETTRILEKEIHSDLLFFLHTYQVHDPYLPEQGLAKLFYKDDRPGFGFNVVQFIKGRKELAKKVPDEKGSRSNRSTMRVYSRLMHGLGSLSNT